MWFVLQSKLFGWGSEYIFLKKWYFQDLISLSIACTEEIMYYCALIWSYLQSGRTFVLQTFYYAAKNHLRVIFWWLAMHERNVMLFLSSCCISQSRNTDLIQVTQKHETVRQKWNIAWWYWTILTLPNERTWLTFCLGISWTCADYWFLNYVGSYSLQCIFTKFFAKLFSMLL